MGRCSKRLLTLLGLVIFLFLPSCLYREMVYIPPNKQSQQGENREIYNETLKKKVVDKINQSHQHLVVGDYKKAIDIYKETLDKDPEDKTLLSNYIKTIEDTKNTANKAFDRKDYALAGRIYHILLSDYPHLKRFVQSLSFDSGFLNERISDCRAYLTQKGIEQYRKGHLTDAISIWKSILIFDPNNAVIKKATDTTSLQLKNLQEKK